MRYYQTILVALVALCPSGTVRGQFAEAQAEAGIDHFSRHNSLMGGGAAFFDSDRDGDEDLYITAGVDADHFYVNQGDGTFLRDTLAGFGITAGYYTTGVIAGDIDNDGYPDVFVSTWGTSSEPLAKNLLFHNQRDGTFIEIWTQTALADLAFSMGATFLDYDLDGLLDIYVINYVEIPEFIYDNEGEVIGFNHQCFSNEFYRNLGNGQFERRTGSVGLGDMGCALAVTATDYDLDGLQDIYIANDFGPFIQSNKLYRNRTSGLFQNMSVQTGANIEMYGMGIAIGDYDKDLDLDYYITNFGRNVLLRNEGGQSFTDITTTAGVEDAWALGDSLMAVGWGTAFLDADHDTDLDLFISNGYVPSPDFLPSHVNQNDAFYLNHGDGTFARTTEAWGINNTFTSRGMAYADYDLDGDLDIVSVVLNVPVGLGGWRTKLYRNTTDSKKNWSQIRLEGVSVNRDAYGSMVWLYAGDEVLMREVSGGASHGSMHSPVLHFGLDEIDRIDSVKIAWTGRKRVQMIYDLPVNERILIQEDTLLPTSAQFIRHISDQVIVYPVPASDEIRFAADSGEINITHALLYDSRGIERISTTGQWLKTMSLQGLPGGNYYLKLVTDSGVVVKRVPVLR